MCIRHVYIACLLCRSVQYLCILNSCTIELVFPSSVQECGATEGLLQRAFLQCLEGQNDILCWSLTAPVTVGFYRDLHHYLRHWPPARSATKTTVGRFYLLVDVNFKMSARPDNIYTFVQKVVDSLRLSSEPMYYGMDKTVERLKNVVGGYQQELKTMSHKVSEQQEALEEMKRQLEIASTELVSSKRALTDISNQLQKTVKQRDTARKQACKVQDKFEAAYIDSIYYEDEMQAKYDQLTDYIKCLKSEANLAVCDAPFDFETMDGGHYTTAVRQLYYKLLADQLPPAKISSTIKSILKSFLPSLDVDKLKLPGESCASYMRREELTTINLAHNVESLLKSDSLNLNCDGTTLSQRKLQGAAINGIVLSVNEIPDGSADSMIADISYELQKLRNIANKLNLPNADRINWTLITSSSSDSASTQKRFNKLVKEKKEEDREQFGPPGECPDFTELVENFCCMHLGVNLRKAFFSTTDSADSGVMDSASSDVLVHEFCKLLSITGGKHGVPEYGHGAVTFPDFLALMASQSGSSEAGYYQQCAKVRLERQVGSRYFVTAANAGKILFLRDAAINFFKYTGKEKGNKLEQSVLQKLKDPLELAHLKADAVMFHHVYSNLVMLAKSKELNKHVFDMNKHYLELQTFLSEAECNPEKVMDQNAQVFPSEKRLYGEDEKVNHRLHSGYEHIENTIFSNEETDEHLFYPLLASGALKMNEKLSSYAQNQLPDGKYWEPEPDIKRILKSLKPNNDVCESILGLNDYLSMVMPNLHQMSKSNLVQVKTMQWLNTLPSDRQHDIVELARKNRIQVKKDYNSAEEDRRKFRQEKMIREKNRRDALQKRADEEKDKLSKVYLIASMDELKCALSEIDQENISTVKKGQKKRALLREQINVRKKVFKEVVNIPFTAKRKQRPLSDIIREFSTLLECEGSADGLVNSTHSYTSESLVGRKVLHRFKVDSEERWFSGFIVSYNHRARLHEIIYDGEEEHCFFNLLEDLSKGDLVVQTD